MRTDDKMKLLYLMRLLQEETDPAHPLNASQLGEMMQARYGCSSERKTIYSDISHLQAYGLRIGQVKGRRFGYYLESQGFDLPELKLLVDAVQSSKFITKEKTGDLIRKLEQLTSHEYAKQLQRQVFIFNRIKADNDAIYANVDAIHSAIHANRKICFQYCEWTPDMTLVKRRNGEDYTVSPWALTWNDENYYLVGYENHGGEGRIRHYRVDKMQDIRVMEEGRDGKDEFSGFDLAAFSRKTFGMFGGEDRSLTLEGENRLAGVVIDRFGKDIMMHRKRGEERFRAHVEVTVSPQFFGWLAGIGKGIWIASPKDVREQYKAYLQEIIDA